MALQERKIGRAITAYVRRTPGWRHVLTILLVPVAVFGIYIRFTWLFDVFCRSPDELAEVMPGLRLHGLPLLNLRDPIRYNFIQSLFFSQHGLGDVSFYYLASGVLSLGLPVSERFLFIASGLTNVGLAFAGAILAKRLLESAATGWVFAMLVLVSPFYVFVSKTGWGRLTWTPLLAILLFLCQWKAMRGRTGWWPAAFWVLAGFISLTDGFLMLPIVAVLGFLLTDGGFADRLRRLGRDRVFLAGFILFALGVTADLLIGLGAMHRGTNLTMMAYVLFKGTHGAFLPSAAVLAALPESIDAYFPMRGTWLLVIVAFMLAAWNGWQGRAVGFLAAWWLLAAVALLRYAAGNEAVGYPPTPGYMNAYNLAVPSFLLVAWLIGSIMEGRIVLANRLTPFLRGAIAIALLLPLLTLMGIRAHAAAFVVPSEETSPVPVSACRTIKAAAFYVRSHEPGVPYVFHLWDGRHDVFLGSIGEFYSGLSYARGSRPEDPNHLLDFGFTQYGRPHALDEFHRAYGVQHFDYYVDFVDHRTPFKVAAVNQLLAEGAHVVCTIWNDGRPIGRILSFRDEPPTDLDYRAAASGWDATFARAGTLLQPLAGTAYHFGYNWRALE